MKRTFYPDFFQGSRRVEMVYTCVLGHSLGFFLFFYSDLLWPSFHSTTYLVEVGITHKFSG